MITKQIPHIVWEFGKAVKGLRSMKQKKTDMKTGI